MILSKIVSRYDNLVLLDEWSFMDVKWEWMQVPSIDIVEKNPQKLDAWIKSIKELHCNEPPPTVNFSKPMPKMEMLKQVSFVPSVIFSKFWSWEVV